MVIVLVLAPIVLGLLLWALSAYTDAWAKWSGVVIAAITFLVLLFVPMSDVSIVWLQRPFTASFHFGLGGIAYWLTLLLALCTACAIAATRVPRPSVFVAQMLILEGAMLGLFCAKDLLVFALFWDLMLLPVFLLMLGWGGHVSSAWRYLIYNFVGGLALLLAVAAFGIAYGSTDVIGAANVTPLGNVWQPWIFAGFAFAFLVKTPVWPFHTWMPATYTDLPSPVVAVVGSVQSKAGLYGFLAITPILFPDATAAAAPLMVVLGLISMLYGAYVALTADDVKRVVAYSSLSHLGLILLAVFSLNPVAQRGALVYMIGHGLFTAGIFLVLGFIEEREETRSIQRYGGLGERNPRLAGGLLLCVLAALGLPGLAGFAGELLILTGIYQHGWVWPAAIALIPIVLAAAYGLRLFQAIMWGPRVADLPERPDLRWGEGLALAPLVIAFVLLGVYARPLVTSNDPGFAPLQTGASVSYLGEHR